MPRHLNFAAIRYLGSFLLILIGVGLIGFVLSGGLDSSTDEDVEQTADATAVAADLSSGDGTAAAVETSAPTAQPTILPLIKAGPESCPAGWRFVDNPQERYTVCLPRNLVYFNSQTFARQTLDTLGDVWPADIDVMSLANEQWIVGSPPGGSQISNPALTAIRITIDVVPTGATFEGCDPRNEAPGAGGVVACGASFATLDGQTVFQPGGILHSFKALAPTLPGQPVSSVFSLSMDAVGYSSDFPSQEPMFRLIAESLKAY